MGLFGTSPRKKLEKARVCQAQGNFYDALGLYQDLARAGSHLSPGEISEAAQGALACRREMIRRRLDEAEALRLSGDLEGARDRCHTALDLAGGELDPAAIEEQMRKIDAPRRPRSSSGTVQDALESDLLPEAGEVVVPQATPVDRKPAAVGPKSDEELFGNDPEALFEVYLHTFDPETAELYRSLGRDFQLGYLALVQGEGGRAVEFFDRLDWTRIRDPRPVLDRAHALLLASRPEDALDQLETMEIPEGDDPVLREARARRRYLKVEVLRSQSRYEEAVDEAKALADQVGGGAATESLLAWTLLEAGRAEEAFSRLKDWMEAGDAPEEILVPGAQAAAALGRADEAIQWLASLIERRLQRSVMHGTEVDFPIEAGRRLLALYLQEESHPDDVRSLALHLLDHDPERAEDYRELLVKMDLQS
jgi:tetratricopeptide (TPR) repeat protein